MRLRRLKRTDELWEEMRNRMIAETSQWLTHALEHPEESVRIPTVRAGTGEFPPSLARAFWEPVLTD